MASGRGALGLALTIAVLTSGCFATREDVRLLQSDLTAMRAASEQADSARRAQFDRLLTRLAQLNDSIGAVNTRAIKSNGDIRGDLYGIGQQLIQIQELTGQSGSQISALKAQLEQQRRATATTLTAPGVATGPGDTGQTASGGPGPNQLFQLALDQLRRGSTGAARAGFQDLLRRYPNADVAADAQFYLAETYAQEGNSAAADSGYQTVASRYPTSPRAPTALFKHAVVMEAAGKSQAARAAYQDVMRKYPRSDEAVLAKERLRDLK